MTTTTATLSFSNPDILIEKSELFDPDVMDALLRDTKSFSKRDLHNLGRYKRGRDHANRVKVQYHWGRGCEELKIGRLYVRDGQGLQAFPFDIRNPLLEKFYFDIDMENCHYHLMRQLCEKYNLKNDAIKKYCDNREEELAKVSSNRCVAKVAFLKVAYGGNIKLYHEHYNDEGIAPDGDITLLNAIEREIAVIIQYLKSVRPDIYKIAEKKTKKGKDGNTNFSFLALFLQTEECRCLLAMDEYYRSVGRSVDILIHDGCEVRKLDGESTFPTELLRGAEAYIQQKTGYTMRLVQKPFQHNFQAPPSTSTQYEKEKQEFEKTHFKLNNPPTYIRLIGKKIQYLNLSELYLLYKSKYIGEKRFLDLWTDDETQRTYEGFVYMPKQEAPTGYYNLFTGFETEAIEGDCSAIAEVLDLVSNHNAETRDYIEKWVASIIQKPYQKNGTALVVEGEEGVGKDTYFNFVGSLLGDEYFFNTSRPEEDVFGRFNGHLKKVLLMKFEEAKYATNKKNSDDLKSLITAETLSYEDKGVKTIQMNSYINLVMTTNHEVPVVLSETNRRFVLIQASSAKRGDFDFWERIHSALADPAVKAAYHYRLLNLDLSDFNPRKFPLTDYHKEIKKCFRPYHAIHFQRIIQDDIDDETVYHLRARDLYENMKQTSKYEMTETKFGRDIQLYASVVEKVRRKDGQYYQFVSKHMRAFLIEKNWWYEL